MHSVGGKGKLAFAQCSSTSIIFFHAAANAPTGLAAEVVEDASISISWTAPTSGATVTGYRINYQEEDAQDRIINPNSMDVDASTTEHNITLVLTAGHSYVITVRALSRQLPSPAVGPPTLTLGKCNLFLTHSLETLPCFSSDTLIVVIDS